MPNQTMPALNLLIMISTIAGFEVLELIDIESNSFDFSHFH